MYATTILLAVFTILVLLCHHVRAQGKFRKEMRKETQEMKCLLIKIELNQMKPVKVCAKFEKADLQRVFDNSIPPRI